MDRHAATLGRYAMFIQVIEGRAKDPEAVHRRLEAWQQDLMPGAIGYLGSTGGCTSGGDCIIVARFESREAARRNSDRPEQTAWWRETEKCFDGPVTFHDSDDIEIMTHGRLDDAHFVQVMEGSVADVERARQLEHDSDPILAARRPELLGAVTAFFDDHHFTEIAYFTDETAARRGEQQAMPADMATMFEEWQHVMKVDRYLDLEHPWLVSA